MYASLALFVTLFLPWYQETGLVNGRRLESTSVSLTGWAAFSWVEAAVLLVAVCVMVLLFQRAAGRAFHLPGGDGFVITAAGAWTCVLIVWRIFDKQGVTTAGQFATTSGIEWGIFVALAVAAWLAYTGSRIRAAHRPEPPLPGDNGPGSDWMQAEAPASGRAGAPLPARRRRMGSVEPVRAPTPRSRGVAAEEVPAWSGEPPVWGERAPTDPEEPVTVARAEAATVARDEAPTVGGTRRRRSRGTRRDRPFPRSRGPLRRRAVRGAAPGPTSS